MFLLLIDKIMNKYHNSSFFGRPAVTRPFCLTVVGIRTRNVAVLFRARILYTTNGKNENELWRYREYLSDNDVGCVLHTWKKKGLYFVGDSIIIIYYYHLDNLVAILHTITKRCTDVCNFAFPSVLYMAYNGKLTKRGIDLFAPD